MEITKKLEKLASLREAKRERQEQIKDLNVDLDCLNNELVEYFQDNDLKNLKLDGLGMFYMAHTSRPNVEDPLVVGEWLKDKGDYDAMMSFNTKKFQEYYNELLDAGQPLPPGVKQFIKAEVRMRRG